jgi:hypothetical protein
LLLDPGYTNLEKLIQVRAKDREELHSLDKWLSGVLRFLENAPVELQPAQFAIDKIFRSRKTLFLRKILPEQLNRGGRLLGNTSFGGRCRHLRSLLNG